MRFFIRSKILDVLTTVVLILISPCLIFARHPRIIPVGPGIMHYEIYLTAGPWAINVLEIDLTNDLVSFETIKAQNRLEGRAKTSELARSVDHPTHWVVGAINGDFFSVSGVPVGAQVANGLLVCNPTARSVFGITDKKKPFIDIVLLNAGIHTKNKQKRMINGINISRNENELILYNRFKGDRTGTNQWGAEAVVHLLTDPLINDTMTCIIDRIDSVSGNNLIPANGFILSGHDSSREFILSNLRETDTLKLFVGLQPEVGKINELIGGLPRIIRNGKISVEYEREAISEQFATDRHPRSAIGFTEDSSKVLFVTVDGRQPEYSVGMSLFELASFMLNFDVYNALNLDGGGSTTMVVRNRIVNRPSDSTGERPVANALLVISKAVQAGLSSIRIMTDNDNLIAGQKRRFAIAGFDRYFNPVTVPLKSVKWSCDPDFGEITIEGLFTAYDKQNSGYIYVQHNNLHDSLKVYVQSEK